MVDLKPCPFCGGKNIIHFNNGFFVQVYCVNCNCGTAVYKRDPDRDRAVEAWNRRAEPVKEQPAADVTEVRHGRWDYDISDVGWTDYSCSVCRNIITVEAQDEDLYSYCPYCGAKMDGKDGDENG